MDPSMVFAIIFALIFMGFVLVFGAQTISDLFAIGGQASLQQTVKNLEQAVSTVYNLAQGSTQEFRFSLPGGARLCFLTPPDYTKKPERGWNPDPVVLSAFLQNPNSPHFNNNMWIYKSGADSFGEGYKMPFTATSFNFCRSSGQLLLENQGARVFVTLLN